MMLDYQSRVDQHFHSAASYWKRIYQLGDVRSVIHQQRRERVLALVDSLALPKSARVLEIGCGAGLTAVAVAQRGYRVDAIDTVPDMIDYTRKLAEGAGVPERVHASLGDVHKLAAADGTYGLVLTIGVLPWLRDVRRPLAEIRRVLTPGGSLIVNADNLWSLERILDPRLNPVTQPLKQALREALHRLRLRETVARERPVSRRRFDRDIEESGFTKIAGMTLGFGPFTMFGRELLTRGRGVRLNRHLQEWADRHVSVIQWCGAQYLVVARSGS